MSELDPRLHAVRPDLADRSLADRVHRPRYVGSATKRVVAASAPLRREPRSDSRLDTEALHGETVSVFEETEEGWAWVQLAGDRYVGWCPSQALGGDAAAATHRVATLRTWVYPGPDIKLPPVMLASLCSRFCVSEIEGKFARTEAGFVFADHLRPLGEWEGDWVTVAKRLVGTPYFWGGRTSLGLDCSALVQLALMACGSDCPRDSDMQEGALGEETQERDPQRFMRGDLVFWKGHVAISLGDNRLLHANGHHMDTMIEPADEAVRRIARGEGLEITSVRRLGSG